MRYADCSLQPLPTLLALRGRCGVVLGWPDLLATGCWLTVHLLQSKLHGSFAGNHQMAPLPCKKRFPEGDRVSTLSQSLCRTQCLVFTASWEA